MLSPTQSTRWIAHFLAILAFAGTASTVSAASADFEVGEGYLSASVRVLVESHEWSLVWSASEDRMVSHPFTIENNSLQGALESLLAMYRGEFVADLYRGNRVVVVNTPPPRVDIEVSGAVSAEDLAQQSTTSPAVPDLSRADEDAVIEDPVVIAYEASGPDNPNGETPQQWTGNESESSGSR